MRYINFRDIQKYNLCETTHFHGVLCYLEQRLHLVSCYWPKFLIKQIRLHTENPDKTIYKTANSLVKLLCLCRCDREIERLCRCVSHHILIYLKDFPRMECSPVKYLYGANSRGAYLKLYKNSIQLHPHAHVKRCTAQKLKLNNFKGSV